MLTLTASLSRVITIPQRAWLFHCAQTGIQADVILHWWLLTQSIYRTWLQRGMGASWPEALCPTRHWRLCKDPYPQALSTPKWNRCCFPTQSSCPSVERTKPMSIKEHLLTTSLAQKSRDIASYNVHHKLCHRSTSWCIPHQGAPMWYLQACYRACA